jgi:uncharacterized membrane protein
MLESRKITQRLLAGLAGVVAGLGPAAAAQAQSSSDCPDDSMGGWWIFFPILFAVFMVVAIVRMLGGNNPLRMMGMMGMMGGMRGGHGHGDDGGDGGSRPPGGESGGPTETPLQAAQRRYANGEISREEFQRIRDDLG